MAMRAFTMVAGGHAASGQSAMFLQAGGQNHEELRILLKPLDDTELEVYDCLSSTYDNDPVRGFIPRFHGVQDQTSSNATFLCLDNLLYGFRNPRVMDVKLGMRTHLLTEMQNDKPREDLFLKMRQNLKSHLTSAELEARAVTKSRYMQLRDSQSTTGTLGYRVDGIVGACNGQGQSKYNIGETEDAASQAFHQFVQGSHPARLAANVVEELQRLRSAMDSSEFVKQHECIGTSVLIVADDESGRCCASWIDFAKTRRCKSLEGLSHRVSPIVESQEEGLLLGLDNLIAMWQTIAQNYLTESTACEEDYSLLHMMSKTACHKDLRSRPLDSSCLVDARLPCDADPGMRGSTSNTMCLAH